MDQVEEIVTEDGVRLFTRTKGNGDVKVLVPNAIYMENVFDSLLQEFQFFFYDMRNRGRSETLTDPVKLARGVQNDVDDLEAVRRHFGLRHVKLIGHSYLGLVAALYAIKHSDNVERVIQIGPQQPDASKQYPPHLANNDTVIREVFAALGSIQSRTEKGDPIAFCREAWTHLRKMYVADQANTNKIAEWGYCEQSNERNMLAYFNTYVLPSIRALKLTVDDFSKVLAPVLVIHGAKDRNAPLGGGVDWASSFPNARLLTLPESAHVPWVEAPLPTLDAIRRFLLGEWPEAAKKLSSS